jgi:hypothetical protein
LLQNSLKDKLFLFLQQPPKKIMNQLISWLVGLFVPRLMETQGRDIKGPFSKKILSHTRHDFEKCESEFFKEGVLMSNDTLLKIAKN